MADITANSSTLTDRKRAAFFGMLAGLAAALIDAVLARILMRVIALLATGQGSFSIGGTAVIFVFALLVGPLFGLCYQALHPRLPGPAWVKGILFGLILVVLLQIPGLFISPDFRAELMVVGPIGFAIFGLMNFAYVLLLAFMYERIAARWPSDGSLDATINNGRWILGGMAVLGAVLLAVEIGGQLLDMIK